MNGLFPQPARATTPGRPYIFPSLSRRGSPMWLPYLQGGPTALPYSSRAVGMTSSAKRRMLARTWRCGTRPPGLNQQIT